MLKALLERHALLQSHRTRLRVALDRIQNLPIDVDRLFAELMADKVFKRLGADHHKQVRADLHKERLPGRRVVAGVALYHCEREWPVLDADVRAFREFAKQAPSAVPAYLARTGGLRQNLTDESEVLIQVLDEQRRARFRVELADAPPSVVRALYEHARDSDTDEAWSLVRWVESHRNGWTGKQPNSDQELAEAQELRRLVVETQEARVPLELDQVSETITETSKLVNRAKQLHGIEPVNLEQRPDLQSAYEAELRELAELESAERRAS